MIGDSDDKINFPHELLLTNRQVSNLRKAFADKSSTDIKLSKIQISKMTQPGRYQIMKWKALLKWLNLLKILIHYYKELVKQIKIKLKNKKENFLVCY